VKQRSAPWIHSGPIDSAFILAPAFLVAVLPWFLPRDWVDAEELGPLSWILLILLIDVAHVYGTLFRSWFDPWQREVLSSKLWFILLACWAGGAALYSWGPDKFWRALAYLAVFHFIRQQFGFVRLYSRREIDAPRWWRWTDGFFIYMATGFPLLFWHLHSDRNFNWFMPGDFWIFSSLSETATVALTAAGLLLAGGACVGYVLREVAAFRAYRVLNWPRMAIAIGTLLSWNVGIVLFNSDLVFTMTNVVAHGIPYMALTWSYSSRNPIPLARSRPVWQYLGVFIGVLVLAAYVEELLWDNFIWSEHRQIFPKWIDSFSDPATLAWLIPLLALPQSAHYVLDGFIWKTRSVSKTMAG
jgi:membrane protease YdiL (CAAX protease family)